MLHSPHVVVIMFHSIEHDTSSLGNFKYSNILAWCILGNECWLCSYHYRECIFNKSCWGSLSLLNIFHLACVIWFMEQLWRFIILMRSDLQNKWCFVNFIVVKEFQIQLAWLYNSFHHVPSGWIIDLVWRSRGTAAMKNFCNALKWTWTIIGIRYLFIGVAFL